MGRRVTLEIHQRNGIILEAKDQNYSKLMLSTDVATIKKVLENYKNPPDITVDVVIHGQIWEEIHETLKKPK